MSSGADQRWRRADQPANERAEACCAAMTFEEKVLVALGDFAAVAHLGVSPLQYTDGPNGIRGPDNVTAFPASLALAATGRSSRDTRGRAGFEVGARARMPVGS